MKKTVSIGLGGRNFIIDEDAYYKLKNHLDTYRASLKENRSEIMEEIEMRIADLFKENLGGREVVNLELAKIWRLHLQANQWPGTSTPTSQVRREKTVSNK